MKRCLPALTGLLLFLAPLKFSAPVNVQSVSPPPASAAEWLVWSWPNQLGAMMGFGLLLLLVLERPTGGRCSVSVRHGNGDDGASPSGTGRFGLFGLLPVVFLATQVISVFRTICWQTSVDTVLHFGVCVAVFYAAARCAREERGADRLLGAMTAATVIVCAVALQQRFGGLEETRRFAETQGVSGEVMRRLASLRVFGTLVYPNALGGYLALVFVPVMAWLWSKKPVISALVAGVIVVCLAFSGSRGGFVALGAGVVAWLICRKGGRWQWVLGIVAVLVVFASTAMWRGTSSWGARLDYWGGAVRIVRDYPWLGTGPGTFGSIYPKYKTAPTEEAQLVHNNFLQMWSDSGVAAFVVFAAMWAVGLWEAARLARRRGDVLGAALVAGMAGWTVHGMMDFDLYLPGIALPAFAVAGMALGLRMKEEGPVCESCGVSRWGVRLATVTGMVLAVWWFEGRMLRAAVAYGPGKLSGLAEACRLAPRNPHYWSALGDAAMGARDFEMATGCYRRAVELDPMRGSRRKRLEQARLAEESVRQGGAGLIESAPVPGEKN